MPLQTPRVDTDAEHSHHCLSDLLRTKDEIHLEIYAMTTDEGVREMNTSAAQAAGESVEQKIARLERELAAAQAEIATLRVNAEKWRSYEMSKNQANKECGK